MGIKDIFNNVADTITAMRRGLIVSKEADRLNVDQDALDSTYGMFTEKQVNYVAFVQENTSEAGLAFSEYLAHNFKEKGAVNGWKDYFSIINETIEEVTNNNQADETHFLGQLQYRTSLFEEYYDSRSKDIKYLLDIMTSKHDVLDLCSRTPKAADIIDANENSFSEKQNTTPQI